MRRFGISMRWWLALAFASIAAVTAVAVSEVFSQRTERAFRDRAEELAVGNAVSAADAVTRAVARGDLNRALPDIAERRRLALFVFNRTGALLTPARSRRTALSAVPEWRSGLARALRDRRSIATFDDGQSIVVALPLNGTKREVALVAYGFRPELGAELGIVREKIVEAALWAVAAGALAGLLVALLIATRLRRIASAASSIEAGRFDRPLRPRFRDELGELASTIDRMRERLRLSFAELEAERDRLERLLARLQDGVVTVDGELRVEFANKAAGRILAGRRLVEGEKLPEPWPDFSLGAFASGLFRRDAQVVEARVTVDEAHAYALGGIPAPLGSQTALLVFADVTERERRERAEREFVTNAAHELRTPLAAIASAVEVLQAGAKEVPADRDRFLASIERQSERLGRLTRTLLTLARAETREEATKLVPVELLPLLEEVARGVVPDEGVAVDVTCSAGLAALADRGLLEQALTNLALNSAKHTARGEIELSAHPAGHETVVIEVRDSGSGLSAAEQERVFERFYRVGEGGSTEGFGLGLAIVRQTVRALGGTVELESAPGEGTVVRVALALARVEAAATR